MANFKTYLKLFASTFSLSAFTFGGGYVIVPLMQKRFVDTLHWIDEEEMLYRIKALLRRARIANERKIVIGDVVLDYDSQTVRRGDEIQELPQKEFLLLYKLLSYPGKIFTRIQLMDEIWGSESETGWETVTVHIGRLRKRFENYTEFKIESVRGLGYKAVKTI